MKRLDLEAGDLILIARSYVGLIELATRHDPSEDSKAINRVAFDALTKLEEASDTLKDHAKEVER